MAIFPLLGAFDHGLVAGLPLSEQPLVADQDDLDGDQDTNELVPDWQRFALTELRPSVRQNGRTELVVPSGRRRASDRWRFPSRHRVGTRVCLPTGRRRGDALRRGAVYGGLEDMTTSLWSWRSRMTGERAGTARTGTGAAAFDAHPRA